MFIEQTPPFVPYPLIANKHLMTIVPGLIPRLFPDLKSSGQSRLFKVAPNVKVLAWCHFHQNAAGHPTLLLLHGLEGSSEAHYILGTTRKALAAGFNVVRMNMRNCGGTEHLTPTLYDSGMSGDPIAVLHELAKKDGLSGFYMAGWSLGGNVALKAAAEISAQNSQLLKAVCAISPAIDLSSCVDALETGLNRIYQKRFLNGLRRKMILKGNLFPDRYDLAPLAAIRTIREFDDIYTAPSGGYGTAADYYRKASSLNSLARICVPTLIIQAQDDPFVPFAPFLSENVQTDYIQVLSPKKGGHAGFLNNRQEDKQHFDRFWAENRIVSFCRAISAGYTGARRS